ncbi:hypothetical protein [Methylobacterium sp. Leaf456]|uniref:hypothetical protein n=1 Tax=Methylobacterium sp. Leaf456 TaxID=1736382 RepID=UPI001AECA4C2|nr:hypothetical protein [Methylobacterium sp. Leaf456]
MSQYLSSIPKPQTNFACPICESVQTYAMNNHYHDSYPYPNYLSHGERVKANYVCLGCRTHNRVFFIYLDAASKQITKVGQHPAWTIDSDENIEQMLGSHKNYLRRGQICESQGYGIAAFAYYRRIIEEVIDGLLDRIPALLSDQEKEQYQAALERTKTTRVAAEKIELVKDLMPPILRPNNMNPLKALHEALSEGLHSQSEEQCLELSEVIRGALVFLATQINVSTAAANSFTESMRKLLEKKSGRS